MSAPSNNVQWKNIDLCMDLYCDCGMTSHADGWSFGWVQCPGCKVIWKLSHQVDMHKVTPNDEYIPGNPLQAHE